LTPLAFGTDSSAQDHRLAEAEERSPDAGAKPIRFTNEAAVIGKNE
jgi:hypothetical protein